MDLGRVFWRGVGFVFSKSRFWECRICIRADLLSTNWCGDPDGTIRVELGEEPLYS